MAQTIPPPRYSEAEFQTNEVSAATTEIPSTSQPKADVKQDLVEKVAKVTIKDFNPYHNPFSVEESEADKTYAFPHLKPVFPTDINMEPYKPIHNFVDRGTFADKSKANLLSACSEVDNLQVNIGTELKGLNLRDLTSVQKDELALLVAERGVVVLRQQDLTPEELVEFGKYFGAEERPLHTHPSSGVPRQRGLDEIHVVWHDENMRPSDQAYTKTELYHTDVPFELNPPGFTALYNITNPVHGGGDTLFSSCYGLYDSLSPQMREYLESLEVMQTGLEQAEGASKAGLHLRRPGIETAHPLVRTHPATGWKSVFASPAFSKSIVGIPKHESDSILNMLFSLMAISSDLTLRVRWEKNTIVLWDNRCTNHSATYDHWRPSPDCRRHALRVAATAEIPSLFLPNGEEGKSRQESVWEEQGFDVAALNARNRAAGGRKGGFKD